MSFEDRGVRRIGAGIVLALLIGATALCFFFLIVVLDLSGGATSIGALTAACFVLLIIELVVAGKLLGRRRAGYRGSND